MCQHPYAIYTQRQLSYQDIALLLSLRKVLMNLETRVSFHEIGNKV